MVNCNSFFLFCGHILKIWPKLQKNRGYLFTINLKSVKMLIMDYFGLGYYII